MPSLKTLILGLTDRRNGGNLVGNQIVKRNSGAAQADAKQQPCPLVLAQPYTPDVLLSFWRKFEMPQVQHDDAAAASHSSDNGLSI